MIVLYNNTSLNIKKKTVFLPVDSSWKSSHDILHNKQNICPSSTCNIHSGYFLLSFSSRLDHELSVWAEGGNLTSWSKKQRTFSLKTYPCVSFYQFSTKKNYILPKNRQLCLFFNMTVMCIYQPFRLANLNKGHVCVTPIGDSLRMRLVPGPNMKNNALSFECLRNRRWQRVFYSFSKVNVLKKAYLCSKSLF